MSAAGFYGVSAGMQMGSAIGGMIGGFFMAKAAKAQGKLQATMALNAAYAKADALRANAQEISRIAGEQEYALYKQQQRNLDSMTARAANNGLMMEGSNVELLAGQAKVDAQNRDALIRDSKAQQFKLLFGAQQAVVEGKNQAAYYKAMGSAGAASAIWGGISSGLSGAGKSVGTMAYMSEKNYI